MEKIWVRALFLIAVLTNLVKRIKVFAPDTTKFYQFGTEHSYLSHEPVSFRQTSFTKQGQFTRQVRLMRLGFLICVCMIEGP